MNLFHGLPKKKAEYIGKQAAFCTQMNLLFYLRFDFRRDLVLKNDIVSKNCYASCMLLVDKPRMRRTNFLFIVYWEGVLVVRRAVVCTWYIRMRDEVILARVTKLCVPVK